MSSAHTQGSEQVKEYLAFKLGSEEYGVDILSVQEIRGYDSVTRVPEAPEYIKGVINLRGVIVPVIDLRLKFHFAEAKYDEFTVMIVMNLHGKVIASVVDGVSDVVSLTKDQLQPTPEFGNAVDTRFISGIATVDDRMLILLDIENLVLSAAIGENAVAAEAA